MRNLLLYPQNIFYPSRSLKAFMFAEKIYIFDFFDTRKLVEKFFSPFQDKIGYISLKDKEKLKLEELPKVLAHLQLFGEYLRTPENLSYYYLHQELFEETFSLGLKEKDNDDEIKRALLVLLLAEALDANLLEVSKAITTFEENWKEFFKEKILFKEEIYEFSGPQDWRGSAENLWNLERRLEALKKVMPLFNWQEVMSLDTLLITEVELLQELKEDSTVVSESNISEGIQLIKVERPLNKKIGLSEEENSPKFLQILIIS